jgi:hypothetical protein
VAWKDPAGMVYIIDRVKDGKIFRSFARLDIWIQGHHQCVLQEGYRLRIAAADSSNRAPQLLFAIGFNHSGG